MAKYKVILDSSDIICKPNNIIGSKVYKYLTRNNHLIENDLSKADYIIVNTCGFNKLRENVSVKLFKNYSAKKKKGAKVISIGCLNKINEGLIRTSFPDVILIFDLRELDEIFYNNVKIESIDEACLSEERINNLYNSTDKDFNFIEKTYLLMGRIFYFITKSILGRNSEIRQVLDEAFKQNKFFVEISTGCLSNCSYCIIKKAKGRLQSRSIEQIMRDIDSVYEPNKNLCLVADDCGCYGLDIKENIFSLLYTINEKYPELGIDLCYVNPLWIQKYQTEYINLFRKVKINSANISIQSGSDRIIKLMNRKYSVEKVIKVIKELKQASPQTLIWTHLIAGFPGETNDDFRSTMSILDYFDFATKFVYADREGTPSALMEPKVPEMVKGFRVFRLRIKEAKIFFGKFIKCILT